MEDDSTFNVERSPRYRLAALSRLWSNAVEKQYERDFGVSLAEWRIVAIVGAEGPINAGAIADRGLLEKSHISRLVARLIARNLIQSEPDAEDARKHWLSLTPSGRDVFDKLSVLSKNYDARFLEPLTARERGTFDRLIAKLKLWSEETLDD